MLIIYTDDLSDDLIDKSYNFSKVDLSSRIVYELAQKLSEKDCEEIVNTLNMINNQGIIKIDNISMNYTIRDKSGDTLFPLNRLSSAESLFFICDVAERTKQYILISKDVRQLTSKTLKKFLRLFKDSNYITLFFDDEYLASFYRDEMVGLC